jgi:predicted nucleotidyltransferase
MADKTTEQAIEMMVQRLVDRFDPEQIILFGSQARGMAAPGSDVDLLVIMPVTGSKRAKQLEMRMALHDIAVPKDIILATPDEVARRGTSWVRSSGRRCARERYFMLDLDDEVLEVTRQWVAKAESDLKTAAHILRLKVDCPTDAVCFHAQQCVEKYLKALLVLNGIEFSRTHQISVLVALAGAGPPRSDGGGTGPLHGIRRDHPLSRRLRPHPIRRGAAGCANRPPLAKSGAAAPS